MLRQGPIPLFVHGAIEYVAAALFIAAPFLLGFDSDAATAVSIVIGFLIFLIAASTAGPTGLTDQIPIPAHAVLDFILAGALVAAPFIFGFSDETEALAFFLVLGVAHLLITVGTRFLPAEGRASRSAPRP